MNFSSIHVLNDPIFDQFPNYRHHSEAMRVTSQLTLDQQRSAPLCPIGEWVAAQVQPDGRC